MLMMNSGKILSGSPSLGSWINYGLGTVNENLPGYVVMLDPKGGPLVAPRIGPVDTCRQITQERSFEQRDTIAGSASSGRGLSRIATELLDAIKEKQRVAPK